MDNGPHGFSDPDADNTFNVSEHDEETSTTSSTSDVTQDETKTMFDGTKPLVLELHDLKRIPKDQAGSIPVKLKKKVRRKRKSKDRSKKVNKETSSSGSGTSVVNNETKFYDARESYHGLTGAPTLKTPEGAATAAAKPPTPATATAPADPKTRKVTPVTKPAT